MPSKIRFKLAVYGRPGDKRASISVWDFGTGSMAFVERLNAELNALPRSQSDQEARVAALVVLKREGFTEPDRGGWYDDPRSAP